MKISELAPLRDDRAWIGGLSGSGKTTLARELLMRCDNIVILDPKHDPAWTPEANPNAIFIDRPSQLAKIRRYPVIFRPNETDFANPDVYDELYMHLFRRGNVTVYTDEIAAFATANVYPHYLKVLQNQGRVRHCRMINVTQQPTSIPKCVLSEATVFYTFAFNIPDDCRKVATFVKGYDADSLANFEFFYYRRSKTPKALKLRLPDPNVPRLRLIEQSA